MVMNAKMKEGTLVPKYVLKMIMHVNDAKFNVMDIDDTKVTKLLEKLPLVLFSSNVISL